MTTTLRILAFLGVVVNLGAQSTVERLEQLGVEKLEEETTAFYSAGFEDEATAVAELLAQAQGFFAELCGTEETFAVAILDEATWAQITRYPYGLPFVSGPPNVVCIPGSLDHPLADVVQRPIEHRDPATFEPLSKPEVVQLFVRLIGFHELGHVYSKSCGLEFSQKWMSEFAATFLAYAYLAEHAPEAAALWVEVARDLEKSITPQHTSLKDFEELYVRVGVENYAWYQVVFLQRIEDVYTSHGLSFLDDLKALPESDSAADSLKQLEAVAPGFHTWSNSFGLIE